MAEDIKNLTAVQIASRNAAKIEAEMMQRQLSLFGWYDNQRGMSNVLANSALFTADSSYKEGDDAPRLFLREAVVASTSNVVITYTGEQLRQDEHDVALQIFHIAREQKIGEPIKFKPYAFMEKQLNWSDSKPNYIRLKNSILRLKANSLTISQKRKSNEQQKSSTLYRGRSIIRGFDYEDRDTGEPLSEWVITLEPEIIKLFEDNKLVTYVNQAALKRVALSRSNLSKWLHKYYSSHTDPFPVSIDFLWEMSGISIKKRFHFKQKLTDALNRLVKAEILDSWEYRGENVHVKKSKL